MDKKFIWFCALIIDGLITSSLYFLINFSIFSILRIVWVCLIILTFVLIIAGYSIDVGKVITILMVILFILQFVAMLTVLYKIYIVYGQ